MSTTRTTPPSSPSTEPGLTEWLHPLLPNWRQLAIAPLLAGALGYGGSFLFSPTYQSTTTFLPPQQQQSAAAASLASLGALAGLAGSVGGIKSPADQYVSLMQSVTVADRLIDQFKLMQVYDHTFRQDARKALAKRTQMAVGKKDGLISVSVEDHDPGQAAAMANQYVEELRRMTRTLAITEAQQRRLFFEKQLNEAKSRLIAAQTALQDSGFSPGALKAEPKAAADGYSRLRAELMTAEVRLQSLRANLADSAPEVRQQLSTVQALRQRLDAQESNSSPQGASPDYVSKYREFKYQETLFDLMAKQYELARVDESREGSLIQVIDEARPAERRIFPRRSWFALGGAVAGPILLALLLLGRHHWQGVRSRF